GVDLDKAGNEIVALEIERGGEGGRPGVEAGDHAVLHRQRAVNYLVFQDQIRIRDNQVTHNPVSFPRSARILTEARNLSFASPAKGEKMHPKPSALQPAMPAEGPECFRRAARKSCRRAAPAGFRRGHRAWPRGPGRWWPCGLLRAMRYRAFRHRRWQRPRRAWSAAHSQIGRAHV